MKQILKLYVLFCVIGQSTGSVVGSDVALDAEVKKYLAYSNPVYQAVADKKSYLIGPLVAKGADVNMGYVFEYTALAKAIELNDDSAIEQLFKFGAKFGSDVALDAEIKEYLAYSNPVYQSVADKKII